MILFDLWFAHHYDCQARQSLVFLGRGRVSQGTQKPLVRAAMWLIYTLALRSTAKSLFCAIATDEPLTFAAAAAEEEEVVSDVGFISPGPSSFTLNTSWSSASSRTIHYCGDYSRHIAGGGFPPRIFEIRPGKSGSVRNLSSWFS